GESCASLEVEMKHEGLRGKGHFRLRQRLPLAFTTAPDPDASTQTKEIGIKGAVRADNDPLTDRLPHPQNAKGDITRRLAVSDGLNLEVPGVNPVNTAIAAGEVGGDNHKVTVIEREWPVGHTAPGSRGARQRVRQSRQ